MAAKNIKDMLKAQYVSKLITVADLMSMLIDCSESEPDVVDIRLKNDIMENIMNMVMYYTSLWGIAFEDASYQELSFDGLSEWLLV